MAISLSDSLRRLPLPRADDSALSALPSELENEIIGLFDEFRARLLRYALSFGLSVHDGEEIIQDVFLSLYRHLHLGRSRKNLRGWLFRVVHNLSLKRRHAAHGFRETILSDGSLMEKQIDLGQIPKSNWLRFKDTIASARYFRHCQNGISPVFICGRKAFAIVRLPKFWACH